MASKKARGKKGERDVIAALGDIKEVHVLLNDVTFLNEKSGMTHQIDHILIHPHGVFVIETKNYFGTLTCTEEGFSWYKEVRGKKEKISNPLLQNKNHAITLRRILKSKYEVIPVVVFARNNAPYTPDENVINLEDLLLFVDSYPYKALLSKDDMNEINKVIQEHACDVTNKEHIENIAYLKQYQRENRAQITYALEKGRCPWCEAKIITQGDAYKCEKCTFAFKL